MHRFSWLALGLVACSSSGHGGGDPIPLGQTESGDYNLGPVAVTGSFPNSCAPYDASIVPLLGNDLAGLALSFNGDGQLCDACVQITTAMGRSVVARVITTGQTVGPNDIDLSQHAYDALNLGEYPRAMTWEVVKCPDNGTIRYQFQTGANQWWTSFWVRNPRVPLVSVEVKSMNHADFVALDRGTDGTYTDAHGFGTGSFTIRLTSVDGQVVEDTFSGFTPGGVLTSMQQFN